MGLSTDYVAHLSESLFASGAAPIEYDFHELTAVLNKSSCDFS